VTRFLRRALVAALTLTTLIVGTTPADAGGIVWVDYTIPGHGTWYLYAHRHHAELETFRLHFKSPDGVYGAVSFSAEWFLVEPERATTKIHLTVNSNRTIDQVVVGNSLKAGGPGVRYGGPFISKCKTLVHRARNGFTTWSSPSPTPCKLRDRKHVFHTMQTVVYIWFMDDLAWYLSCVFYSMPAFFYGGEAYQFMPPTHLGGANGKTPLTQRHLYCNPFDVWPPQEGPPGPLWVPR
jgi:hypothetical protein